MQRKRIICIIQSQTYCWASVIFIIRHFLVHMLERNFPLVVNSSLFVRVRTQWNVIQDSHLSSQPALPLQLTVYFQFKPVSNSPWLMTQILLHFTLVFSGWGWSFYSVLISLSPWSVMDPGSNYHKGCPSWCTPEIQGLEKQAQKGLWLLDLTCFSPFYTHLLFFPL